MGAGRAQNAQVVSSKTFKEFLFEQRAELLFELRT